MLLSLARYARADKQPAFPAFCSLSELASGVSFPIGFKNGTDGSVGVAVDAMRASSCPHAFLGMTSQGALAVSDRSLKKGC